MHCLSSSNVSCRWPAHFHTALQCGQQRRQRGGGESRSARPAVQSPQLLDSDQLQQFWRQGYLCIENFASAVECAALRDQANRIVDAFQPNTISVFSTTDQEATTNEYFMGSASDVRCFFEEGAFDEGGRLVQDKNLCINKIGHALHDLDPTFKDFSRSEKMQALYRQLGFKRPLPVQSMYIFKQPSIGGVVVPHQDSAFLATEPLSCVGVWLAVEDATLGNGCLFAASASHHDGVRGRLVLDGKGGVTWPDGPPDYSDLSLEPLETKRGTLVLLHGSNVHGSDANTSELSRHAYSMHVVESADGSEWLPDNWLQRSPRSPFVPLFDET